MKSKDDGDSGNEDVNNLELFSSKEGTEWRKTKFRQNIRCHNIMSRLPGTKGPAKDVTSPMKSKQKEEYEGWMSIDEDIPVAATQINLEICQAVCEQDQTIKIDDSDGDECVEENPSTNV
ncbi:hypothetical protein AVEN_48949-1 [Araneus ventricosus]|uniref:Uncharacterized protein n=1 Tax=Araneus ventricosus TaxID=182803 RepID=A0A4Y2AGR7_ARAVE|nr:hypothetical protein AVEN_48949-1 [Araneus ventricosus]